MDFVSSARGFTYKECGSLHTILPVLRESNVLDYFNTTSNDPFRGVVSPAEKLGPISIIGVRLGVNSKFGNVC